MRLFIYQSTFHDSQEPIISAFISSFCHPATSFCFRSIALAVSSYAVARRLLRFFPVLTDVKARTSHKIRGVELPAQLLKSLENQRKLLFLAKADRKHRCKSGDTMAFRLQVAQLIQHETCFVKPIHPGFRRTLTPAFTSGGSRLSLCRNDHTFLHPALGAVAQPPPY